MLCGRTSVRSLTITSPIPKRTAINLCILRLSALKGKTVEIQIRTYEMHRHAELGVAAHWRYKEGSRPDDVLEKQIAWFREILEWKDESSDAGELLDQIKSEALQDRVYVLTPKGDIVEMPFGATPLDFAYHIHTEVGHRCRGARVNSRIVPLNHQLQSGDQIEIITVKEGQPSRNWLRAHLGYLQSSRARAKVRHWFRQQDKEQNISAGKQAFEQELQRLSIKLKAAEVGSVAERFNFTRSEELYAALGRGDITIAAVVSVLQEITQPQRKEEFVPVSRKPAKARSDKQISIRGVGNLLTQMARCCQPVPFEPVVGYITQGRGVTIHRQDCANVLNLRTQNPGRIVEVDWGQKEIEQVYPVDIQLQAYDRSGLLRDITMVLANEKVNVLAVNTLSDAATGTAHMVLTLEISGLEQLSKVLDKIAQLSNVYQVQRKS